MLCAYQLSRALYRIFELTINDYIVGNCIFPMQLIHELTAELEELRLSKNEALRTIPSSGADLPRSLRSELEDHILQLKKVTLHLSVIIGLLFI